MERETGRWPEYDEEPFGLDSRVRVVFPAPGPRDPRRPRITGTVHGVIPGFRYIHFDKPYQRTLTGMWVEVSACRGLRER